MAANPNSASSNRSLRASAKAGPLMAATLLLIVAFQNCAPSFIAPSDSASSSPAFDRGTPGARVASQEELQRQIGNEQRVVALVEAQVRTARTIDPATLFSSSTNVSLVNCDCVINGPLHLKPGQILWVTGSNLSVKGAIHLGEKGAINPAQAQLRAESSVIEVANSKAKEFEIKLFSGGQLITINSVIGGNIVKDRNQDLIHQTAFSVFPGAHWAAYQTVVRASYGIQMFGGGLNAIQLRPGRNPDFIIMDNQQSSTSNVSLKDSEFGIALRTNALVGGRTELSLTSRWPITQSYTSTNIPSARYQLHLENTRVPLWALFIENVTNAQWSPSSEVHITNVDPVASAENPPVVVVMGVLAGADWVGNADLNSTWRASGPGQGGWTGPAAPSTSTFGKTKFTTGQNVIVNGWSVYLYGHRSNVNIVSETALAELVVTEGARMSVTNPGSVVLGMMAKVFDGGVLYLAPGVTVGSFNETFRTQGTRPTVMMEWSKKEFPAPEFHFERGHMADPIKVQAASGSIVNFIDVRHNGHPVDINGVPRPAVGPVYRFP